MSRGMCTNGDEFMTYYKFLNHNLESYYKLGFFYPAPTRKNGEWIPSEWVEEKECDTSDDACAAGLHLAKKLNPIYFNFTGNCYEAEGECKLAEDEDKIRFRKIRLIRPISFSEIFRPNANLTTAKLNRVELAGAKLTGADLTDAALSDAALSDADLRNADLYNADLTNTDLIHANLTDADLRYANLINADLRNTNLTNANLIYADLTDADLTNANLTDADLTDADLQYADLTNVNLTENKTISLCFWNENTKIDEKFRHLLTKEKFLS